MLSCAHQKVSDCIESISSLILLLAFLSTRSAFIPLLSSMESRLKQMGPASIPVKEKPVCAVSIAERTDSTPANVLSFL